MALTKEQVIEELRPLKDPEMHLGLVDLGLIYDIDIKSDQEVNITMTLTSPACPIGPELMSMVKSTILMIDGVKKCEVEIVFDPPWNPAEMASDEVKDELGIW
jgi:metal-sulfur cluster biosynthetic enzyme